MSPLGVDPTFDSNTHHELSGPYAIRPEPTGSGNSLTITSFFHVQFINWFGALGGFATIQTIMQGEMAGKRMSHEVRYAL